MTRFPLLLLLAAAGCLDTSENVEPGPELGDYGSSTYLRDPYFLIDSWLACGDTSCPTAVGGTRDIEVTRNGWDIVDPVVTGPWALRQIGVGSRIDLYTLDARSAGEGSLALHHEYLQDGGAFKQEGTTTPAPLSALPVADVRVRPQAQIYEHRPFVTDRIAWHIKNPYATVELLPDGAGIRAPSYVIDSSLALGAGNPEGVTQGFSHGEFWLEHVGTYDLVITAGSFGERRLPVTVVDHVERLEGRIAKHPEHVGGEGVVCFDAFTGEDELALAEWQYDIAIEGTPDHGNDHSAENCIELHAYGPGHIRVTGTVEEVTATVDLDIPPST